jgi:hypothetical protein
MLHYKHHGLNYFGLGYQKGIAHAQNYLIHLSRYPKNTLGSITYFLTCGEYFVALPKPRRNVIPSLGYTINTMG